MIFALLNFWCYRNTTFSQTESQSVIYFKVIKIKLYFSLFLGYIVTRCRVSIIRKSVFIIFIQMVSHQTNSIWKLSWTLIYIFLFILSIVFSILEFMSLISNTSLQPKKKKPQLQNWNFSKQQFITQKMKCGTWSTGPGAVLNVTFRTSALHLLHSPPCTI